MAVSNNADQKPDSDATTEYILTELADEQPFKTPVQPLALDETLFAQLQKVYADHRARCSPLAEFKVTQEQFDELLKLVPSDDEPAPTMGYVLGVPVRIVDTYQESTIWEWRLRDYVKQLAEEMADRGLAGFAFETFVPFRFEPYSAYWDLTSRPSRRPMDLSWVDVHQHGY